MTRKAPIFIQSLWSWDASSEELSRGIVYGLKGVSKEEKWSRFAALLLQSILPMPNNSCLVPIPSRSGKEDHAMGLTRALAAQTGWTIENCLSAKPLKGHQRDGGRRERGQIELTKARPLKRSYDHFTFVDDVVTSGFTLQAAYKALGAPNSAQGLCFMDRRLRLSCGI